MAIDSQISWTDHTWNPAIGCSKVDADCLYCYMYRQSYDGTRYEPKEVKRTKTVFNFPLKIKEPAKIFTASLTDIFHEDIDSYRPEIWDIIRRCPQHTFQILTKRPERIKDHLPEDWGNGWDNVWLGTSVGSQLSAHRIVQLLDVPAKVHFASLEPMFGPISLNKIYWPPVGMAYHHVNALSGLTQSRAWELKGNGESGKQIEPMVTDDFGRLSWVIIGGESGNENGKYKYRPCETEWISNLVKECQTSQVPVFVKQLGTHLAKQYKLKHRHGADWDEWPAELSRLKVREFPK